VINHVLENLDDLAASAVDELSTGRVDKLRLKGCVAMQTLRRIKLTSHVRYPWPE